MDLLIKNKIKIYPTFKQIYEFKRPIVNLNALSDKLDKITRNRKNPYILPDYTSVRRSKTTIRDLALCNDFDLFCTFTFAKNRDDIDKCLAQFKQWLKNAKIKSPDLAYLAVPEYHKDKKAIHFHVLLQNYMGKLLDTKKRTKYDQPIYNIKSYRLGFTTAVPINATIDDREKVANYITKYVTKDLICKYNKKRYWCSCGLIRPEEYSNIMRQPKYFDVDNVVFENDSVIIYKKYDKINV